MSSLGQRSGQFVIFLAIVQSLPGFNQVHDGKEVY